ncbi:hypothetical protein HU200_015081 [Digitaria exilis]|uniref:H15 domain-containing protein n=1 Tax=Digitaria exilis TaxID=1010633 RepID=A0A835F9N9_9POAL|nr:hypothetical protein HU200_015081 [Digitaria exilis]CAB3469346.1 unnamed protein product [Digitaria exilis]
MATATEEAAPAAVVAPAPDKVDEVKEAGVVEAAEKVEEAPMPAAEEGKKTEDGETKKAEEGKKARKPRSRKPKSAGPHHPPYFEMIKEAIMAQDGGKVGASPYAIAKHMGEKHRDVLPANYRKVLAVQLRNFAAKGRLVKVKASFKLAAAEEKKAAAAKAKKAAPAKRKRAAAPPPAKKKPAAPAEARKARAKRARKAAPAPAQPMPKPKEQGRPVRAAVATKAANKASA